ncbi:hypothetical protein Q4566_11740 [Tamlana sp. 2_MG-2023]|uniref:hypothetical protein n=1 Tax=unclassified Tamlana TaxID=2614803 RepID=UPI0026E27C64|nr:MULTISPECIES: hypothetical protein [unclassified Tamlana]MDO6760875.1 hypothetical protein [Tamlana sp. 2_MG-2023]MDO6791131.1 hypothetical protein [Tamlana sp. 1_MG-2023]
MKLTKSIKFKIIAILLVALGFVQACKTAKTEIPIATTIEENPKIIFLTYSISEAPSGERSMQFVSQKIVDGSLKNNSDRSVQNAVDGDLICLQFDEQSNIISRSLIKNPLKKSIESLNESKSFEMQSINLNKTKFSTRIALKSQTRNITISNFANSKNLISTKINHE